MSPTEVLAEPKVLTVQGRILNNQEVLKSDLEVIKHNQIDILKNQEKFGFVVKNQETILKNQEKFEFLLKNQDIIVKNQEAILKNQARILSLLEK